MNFRHNRMAAFFRLTALLLLAGTALLAHAQYTVLYDFGFSDATQQYPSGQLTLGRDGNFYGMMNFDYSQMYAISPAGVESVLWKAPQPPAANTQCYTGVTLGGDGKFYGTCDYYGGDGYHTGGSGIIFSYDVDLQAFNIVYSFPPCFNGLANESYHPSALSLGTDGSLYGTTLGNGFCDNPYGTVFKITPQGTFTTLHAFQGWANNDGAYPSLLTLGNDGNFYGTTSAGTSFAANGGSVFQITPKGKVKYIYVFDGSAGQYPQAGVTFGADGKLYGTTQVGGNSGQGTIFQVTKAGKLQYLHSFNQVADNAAYPSAPLTLGSDGSLYGPSSDCYNGGCGKESLFKVTTKGVYSDLYSGFNDHPCDNQSPTGCILSSQMLLDPNGKFYGTTQQGGIFQQQPLGRGVFYTFGGLPAFAELQYPVGKVGSAVGIYGWGLSQTTAVRFNGVAASFTVQSDTYLTAVVPAGAKTGYVTVTEAVGSLRSKTKFAVKK